MNSENFGLGLNRRFRSLRIALEPKGQLGHGHETVGRRSIIGIARQGALPVRCEQPERVPPLRPPGIGHSPPLEDDMVHVALREAAAHRQAAMASADDDG